MAAKTIIQGVYEEVLKRNPGEAEFHQAVKEVLDSLEAVLDNHPEYVEAKILDRIVEPERQIMFLYHGWMIRGTSRSIVDFGSNSTALLDHIKEGLDFTPQSTRAF